MKTAFLYAGQGSQKVSMGRDLYDAYPLFREKFDLLPEELKALAFHGPLEELSRTANTQPIMVAFALGVTALLRDAGIRPQMAAGLSLGEYSALACAGALEDEEALRLVTFRGQEMEKASDGIDTKMAAVLQVDRETLLDCCEQARAEGWVQTANYNCPGQIVLAGEENGVDRACALALEKGAKRCVPLQVSGPFHTKFMKPAGDALAQEFEKTAFHPMEIPVVFNAVGRELAEGETIPALLERQVQSSVYFEDSVRHMIAQGVDTFVEIGPGKTLSGFVKKISRDVKLYNVEDEASFHQLAELWKGGADNER